MGTKKSVLVDLSRFSILVPFGTNIVALRMTPNYLPARPTVESSGGIFSVRCDD
jgi:hypothetical protein